MRGTTTKEADASLRHIARRFSLVVAAAVLGGLLTYRASQEIALIRDSETTKDYILALVVALSTVVLQRQIEEIGPALRRR